MKNIYVGIIIATTLFIFSACRDIFYSKEDIDYVNLILDTTHNSSVGTHDDNTRNKNIPRNYYKFRVEQGATYYFSWRTNYYDSDRRGYNGSLREVYHELIITMFRYDNGGIVMGEREDRNGYGSFTAPYSGDIVIRVTATIVGKGYHWEYDFSPPKTADYRIMVSTQSDNIVQP